MDVEIVKAVVKVMQQLAFRMTHLKSQQFRENFKAFPSTI